jgi:Rrf2 family protein
MIMEDAHREEWKSRLLLSHTGEYALRAVIHLAEHADQGPLRVGDIADALDVPQNYLSKVLHVLARKRILRSTRGPQGGFILRRHADRLSLAEVVAPFDPIEDRCLLIRRQCSETDPCTAHHEWKQVAMRVRGFFRETTIGDLLRSAAEAGRAGRVLLGHDPYSP